MQKYITKTPDGTRDLLFEECELHSQVKNRLSALFMSRGYYEVVTPALEYYDLFSLPGAAFSQTEMIKVTEQGGRLLVLRPDSTMPIARLVSTRLKDAPLPIRLHYAQKVYRVAPGLKGRSNEITQSGVELIGAEGLLYDLETILTAAKALEACSMADYKIELGHAGIFGALAADLPVDEDEKEEIRLLIESKSYSALEDLLDRLPESDAAAAIRMLPRLFGGKEVLEQAAGIFGGRAEKELAYLRELLTRLEPALGDRINLDLGLVHRNNYYTGVVFRAYLPGSGDTVVSGGRYDRLFDAFGSRRPAVGFAVDDDAITAILLAEREEQQKSRRKILFAEAGYEMKALARLEELTAAGVVCEVLPFGDKQESLAIARDRSAAEIELIGELTEIIRLV